MKNTSTTTSSTSTETLLKGFLNKPLARSAESIEDRMEHWAHVANNPHIYTEGDTSAFALAARRKVAVQSLKKLIKRYPEVAVKLQREKPSQEAA